MPRYQDICMLEFKSVTKVFKSDLFKKPVPAISELSFRVDSNSIVGFLGANGAGKTTSLKVAMDFTRPTSGEVTFEGLGKNRSEVFSKIGFLPERPYFYPHLTGREFSTYMGSLVSMPRTRIKEQIEKLAPLFRIDFALDREIKTYSKGMLQRIGFLTALLHDPNLVILDEPLSGVDPIGRKELKDVIVEINKMGKTVFFSSHIVSDVEEICDKVIFLKNGKLVYQGKVDDIINENIKATTRLRYSLDGEVKIEKLANSDKNGRIKELLEMNADILSVDQDRPTLENIFYDVGAK